MKCGLEEGGKRAGERGVCPSYPDHGRNCARIAGTLCNGEISGTFATKLRDCIRCDFYNSPHYDKTYKTFKP